MNTDRPTRRAAARPHPQGFTLIELLVAIAILGILGTVLIKGVYGHIDHAKQVSTQAKLESVHQQVVLFRRAHNTLPKWPDDMLQPDPMNNNEPWLNAEDVRDAWNNEIVLKPGQKSGQFELVSYGANGTEDGFGPELGIDRDLSSTRPMEGADSNTPGR
jgi:general secretion pathway protein G